jgi:glutamyl-Q tRNA(Asp) synthetase
MIATSNYIGRFAPSPSGPLHFGSLVAAIASFLDARKNNGVWLLRIEDLDPPRESALAPGNIIEQLRAHGLYWDSNILYQSTRLNAYADALIELVRLNLVYPCDCIRKNLPPVYPGTCRDKKPNEVKNPHAVRLIVDNNTICINDAVLGAQKWHLASEIGDFIVRRKDSLFSYQLAVVVDDGFQKITHIVRGADLLDSTPRQMYLASKVNLVIPNYMHIPVVLGESGDKLSKQTHAEPIKNENNITNLLQALDFLGQPRPKETSDCNLLLEEATSNWDVGAIPKQTALPQRP